VTTSETLALARSLHEAGQLREAESLYRRVLTADPMNVDALCLLGGACQGQSNLREAARCYERAATIDPDRADAFYFLGAVLAIEDRLDDALGSLQRAWRLKPQDPEINGMLRRVLAAREIKRARLLTEDGQLDEAAACCRYAIELAPHEAVAHENLGNILKGQGKLSEAMECYARALELAPGSAELHCNRGLIWMDRQRLTDAEREFRRALELKPESMEAHNNLGTVLACQRRFEEAAASFRRVLELRPDYAEGHNNLGAALGELGRLDDALECLRRAVQLNPEYAEAHSNLGDALRDSNRIDEALRCYETAIGLKPDYADAHFHRGYALLALGKFVDGWPEYEWRWKLRSARPPRFKQPQWTGADLIGQTILLRAEQGFGDAKQFIRYAPLVKGRGAASIIVECARPAGRLLASCPGVDKIAIAGEPLPPFDTHAALLSLPGIFRTSLDTIPNKVPYLFPDAQAAQAWRDELSQVPGFKVGIAWQGNPGQAKDHFRSMPLGAFAAIAKVPGVRLFSLQAEFGREQLADAAAWPIVDLGDRLGDFYDTAAIVQNLDLVITCDSAPAHLAGALGVPTWLALASACDWRWMIGREDSPWYPTLRLFRQKRLGDWSDVFVRMAAELRQLLATRHAK
jgi:tetratricopeptide (TPR) repeat protein